MVGIRTPPSHQIAQALAPTATTGPLPAHKFLNKYRRDQVDLIIKDNFFTGSELSELISDDVNRNHLLSIRFNENMVPNSTTPTLSFSESYATPFMPLENLNHFTCFNL